ncbi:MAG TPA: TonB-dependent receptor [Sphingopyxis sp.]|nr:TonB-dependent receptor [Sphingopyxis sp.]
MKNFSWLLTGAACLALPMGAYAQDNASSTESQADNYTGLTEIIVTAEKRSVDLQSLSQAVSAYTSETRQLVGLNNLQDFAAFTPGLSYSSGTDRVYIRGIGRQTNTNGSDPGVSTYTDGIYDSSTNTISASDFFIERIEVLRGPQGTLYGRNSIGGAINAISKRPTEDFTADIRTTVANYDVFNLEAAVSGSIIPGLMARLAGGHYEQDKGYFKNSGGNPSEGGRGKRRYVELQLEADLGENVTAWVKAFTGSTDLYPRTLNRIGDFDLAPYPTSAVVPGAGFGYAIPAFLSPDLVALDPNPFPAGAKNIRRFSANTVQRERMRDNFGISGDISWSLPTFDVRLTGGYQQYKLESRFDLDDTSVESYVFPLDPTGECATNPLLVYLGCGPLTVQATQEFNAYNKKSFGSGELSFASTTDGPLQWVAGLYYYQESLKQISRFGSPKQEQMRTPFDLLENPAAANPSGDFVYAGSDLTTKSIAGYGQLTYEVTESLRITGGLRYTHDKKSGTEAFRIICLGCIKVVDNQDPNNNIDLTPPAMGSFTPAIDLTMLQASFLPAEGVSTPTTIDPLTGIAHRGLSNSWDAVTGTLAIEWQPDADQLAFARYSRGYKSGGFNAGGISLEPQTDAEYINAYEAGYKRTIGNRLRANLAAFYYDYKGLQVPLTVPEEGGADLTRFYNLQKSKSYGAEIELAWQATNALQLMLNYGYGKSRINNGCCFVDGEDPLALQPGARPSGDPIYKIPDDPNSPVVQRPQSVEGAQLSDTPNHKISANAMYNIYFSAGTLTLSGGYMWRDSAYSNIFNRKYNKVPSFDQVDLRAIWSGKDDRYRIIAFAKNLFDTTGYASASGNLLESSGQVAQSYALTPPRTFGVQLDYRFR